MLKLIIVDTDTNATLSETFFADFKVSASGNNNANATGKVVINGKRCQLGCNLTELSAEKAEAKKVARAAEKADFKAWQASKQAKK